MSYEQQKERPAYVTFETRAIEDRQESILAGHYVGKDVDFAIITPPGGNLVVEKVVSEWMPELVKQEAAGRNAFYSHYKGLYDAWKSGQEEPISGTSLKNWPVLSPAQLQLCLSLNVRSVEDLANANEIIIQKLGMGGRSLVEKAKNYLAGANDTGKLVEKVNELSVKLESLLESSADKDRQIEDLKRELGADKKLKLPSKAA